MDLPDPFGPMIACTSPLAMVRSTPLRISLAPDSVLTETCRSRISRVDMRYSWLGLRGVVPAGMRWSVRRPGPVRAEVDEDVVAVDTTR